MISRHQRHGLILLTACALLTWSWSTYGQDYDMIVTSDSITNCENAEVQILLDNNGGNIQGWSYSVCHSAEVDVVAVTSGSTTQTANNGGPPDFEAIQLHPNGSDGFTHAVVIEMFGLVTLPPGNGYELSVATYSPEVAAGTATLDFCEIGDPVALNVVIVNGIAEPVNTTSGTISISPAGFTRGDANGDGPVDIPDAIYLLNYLYLGGPGNFNDCCGNPDADAADANDNEFITVADALIIIDYAVQGQPLPPPNNCGQDPTGPGTFPNEEPAFAVTGTLVPKISSLEIVVRLSTPTPLVGVSLALDFGSDLVPGNPAFVLDPGVNGSSGFRIQGTQLVFFANANAGGQLFGPGNDQVLGTLVFESDPGACPEPQWISQTTMGSVLYINTFVDNQFDDHHPATNMEGDEDCNDNGIPDRCELAFGARELTELNASDGDAEDWFGLSVAVDGDVAVVGAWRDDDLAENSGAAYVYRFTGSEWIEEQKLTASDGATWDRFGMSVAVHGDVIIAGAIGNDQVAADAGAAYVFRYDGSTWIEEQKLMMVTTPGSSFDSFGSSVAASGDVVLIGADGDAVGGFNDAGSATVFRYDGSSWIEEQTLVAGDLGANDQFGDSVSVSGDVALIGAWSNNDDGDDSGSAYVFRYDGTHWFEEQKFTGPNADPMDWFGHSVSVSGDVAVISSELEDDPGQSAGAAYVYRYDGTAWFMEQKLASSDLAVGDIFGRAVAVNGDVIVVGASSDDDLGAGSGSAYVFRYNGTSWFEQAKLNASDGAAFDEFGRAVAVSGAVALVGAYTHDHPATDSGSAYLFLLDGADCNNNGVPDECDIADGTSEDCNGNGVPDECDVPGASELAKLTASDAEAGDHFGFSVSVDGDVAVIGADFDDDNGSNSGSAYVFRNVGNDWLEEQKLIDGNGDPLDTFGTSVSVSGDVAVVGAPRNDVLGNDAGTVLVYRYTGSTWLHEQTLLASDGAADNSFGISVSVSGDVIAVGASLDDDDGNNSGSVYLFRYDGLAWFEEDKVTASNGAAEDRFGYAVSVTGGVLLAGARYADTGGSSNAGAAYVFRYDGTLWIEEQVLAASPIFADDEFGSSVGVHGDVAIIGAPAQNVAAPGSAHLYRYDGNSWLLEQMLPAPGGGSNDDFGHAVGVSGDVALVSAYQQDGPGGQGGVAFTYRFDGTSWLQESEILASDGAAGDQFGVSVSVSGNIAAVGSWRNSDAGPESGSAYLFEIHTATSSDCNGNGIPDECDIDLGTSEDCNGNGIPDECDIASGSSSDTNDNGIPDECEAIFLRGDCDGNGIFNALADGLYLLTFGFLGGPPPPCMDAADADDNGVVNALSDSLYILEYGFLGGPQMPPPFPLCGTDPTPDVGGDLGCGPNGCP